MIRAGIRKLANRLIFGKPVVVDPLADWTRRLGGNASFGEGSILAGDIAVRDATGCSLRVGTQSDVEGTICFEKDGVSVQIGARSHLGGGTVIAAAHSVSIGDDVQIAYHSLIMDHNSHSVKYHERKHDVLEWQQGRKDWSNVPMAPVTIGDKAWIGARVIILKGVTVGEGAIVGAGSVVTKDVPAWSIAAGNPARVIRMLSEEERAEDRELIQV